MITAETGWSDTMYVMVFQWVSYKPILGKWIISN